MAGRATAARAEALRRARELRVAREAARRQLDDKIDGAVADLLEANSKAQSVREEAKLRAEQLIAKGEAEAAEHERRAAQAGRILRDLGQTNAEISELCGISVGALRGMLSQIRDEGASVVTSRTV